MQGGFGKTRIGKHFFVLRKSIRVAGVGPYEHVEAERCRSWRSHTVFIGYKLESDGFSTRFERSINAAHERLARWHVEMMENIRQQNEVVSAAKIRFKRASRAVRVAPGNGSGLCILLCDRQHGWPVDGDDFGIWIFLHDGDAVHSVSRGDVQ